MKILSALRTIRWLIGFVLLGFGISANATLIDRGGGLIYDDVLNVTWLQNAGLGGFRGWPDSVAWADALVFGGFDDWRLPSMSVAAGVPTGATNTVVDCSTATELACRDNELGYMYYHDLGGSFGDDLTGDQGLIQNIPQFIWSGTTFAPPFAGTRHAMNYGAGNLGSAGNALFGAWAVRPGDVLPSGVPEPTTLLLLGLGLAGLGFARRRLH